MLSNLKSVCLKFLIGMVYALNRLWQVPCHIGGCIASFSNRCGATLKHLSILIFPLLFCFLSGCADRAPQPRPALSVLSVKQVHAKNAGVNYRYCHTCFHLPHTKEKFHVISV